MKKIAIAIVSFLFSIHAFAGGSIWKMDAIKAVEAQNSSLARILAQLDLEDQGSAVRLGEHLDHRGGERMMPFTFLNKSHTAEIVIQQNDEGQISIVIK